MLGDLKDNITNLKEKCEINLFLIILNVSKYGMYVI